MNKCFMNVFGVRVPKNPLFVLMLVIGTSLSFTGCSGGGPDTNDGGIIIGTGKMKGIATDNRRFAANRIQTKSSDGIVFSTPLAEGNRFLSEQIPGEAPWLIRAETGAGVALYGMGFGGESLETVENSNVNSYSDVVVRNWFIRNGMVLETAFDNTEPFSRLPSEDEFKNISSDLFDLVSFLLETNGVERSDVITGDFITNAPQVDDYLRDNPVFVESGLLSVLSSVDGDQTLNRSNLEIGSALGMADSERPNVPGSVRAVRTGSSEVIVLWEPPEDNVYVAGYNVYKNDALAGRTPYPYYIDSDAVSGLEANYVIEAFDSKGNTSNRSTAVSSQPLNSTNGVAPPAPQSLTGALTSSGLINLVWGVGNLDDVRDVVFFELLRGRSTASLSLYSNVFGTIASDANIDATGNYCYQVVAVKADGLRSAPSEVICVAVASGAATLPVNAVPRSTYQELTISQEVYDQTCDRVLSQSDVQSTTTLQKDCYTVNSDLLLPPGTTLTIPAGTVLRFAELTKLEVGTGAALTAVGTVAEPVIFTGTLAVRGHWIGIVFNRSNKSSNLLRNAVVEYTGAVGSNAGIEVIARESDRTRISMENSLVRFSDTWGLTMTDNGTIIESFSGNKITRNRRIAAFAFDAIEVVGSTNDFTDNDDVEVLIGRNSFSKDIVIPNIGMPLRSGGMNVTGSLTLMPGVVMRMLGSQEIRVDGAFSAVGTESNPISISGWEGNWRGVYLSGRANKEINHLALEDAGIAGEGAINLDCSQSQTSLSISNTEIMASEGWGLAVTPPNGGCTVDVDSTVTFLNNAAGPRNN